MEHPKYICRRAMGELSELAGRDNTLTHYVFYHEVAPCEGEQLPYR